MANKIIMTDGSKSTLIFERKFNPDYAVKGINPFTDDTPGVWSPDSQDLKKDARSLRLVPSVFAGINTRMQAMMDLPFTIYGKGDKAIDNSDNYKNVVGFLPNPAYLFGLSEASLITSGCAYWFKGTGTRTGIVKELKYWIPSSVTLDKDSAKRGEIKFKRQGSQDLFDSTQVFYNWLYDENVELGAPTVYPLESALVAAEANGAISTWVRDYMRRGAIKAMLLSVEGMPPPGEIERMESWWNKFMTGSRGLLWKVFNMTNVKPVIVGDGLEALRDLSINKELRYEIHQALGTRHLLEDENFATADARERQFYNMTIMPDARLIQQNINTQILNAMGYHLEFEPQRLEHNQDTANKQAVAFGQLFAIFKEVMTSEAAFRLAGEKLDYEFTDEQMAMIQAGIAEKQSKAKEVALQMQSNKQPEPVAQPAQVTDTQKPVPPPNKSLIELDKWEKKVIKAGKMVTWHAVDLHPDMVKALSDGVITFEQARERVQDIQPTSDVLLLIMEGLRKAIENA